MEEQNFTPEKVNKLPTWLTTVTPFTRFLALSMFIIFPIIGFYLGILYNQSKSAVVQTQKVAESIPTQPLESSSSAQTQNDLSYCQTYENKTYGFSLKCPDKFYAEENIVDNDDMLVSIQNFKAGEKVDGSVWFWVGRADGAYKGFVDSSAPSVEHRSIGGFDVKISYDGHYLVASWTNKKGVKLFISNIGYRGTTPSQADRDTFRRMVDSLQSI